MPIYERRRRRLAALAETECSLPITFAIVGVQKAGTTSLYSMLVRHPHIAGGHQKELRFFMERRDDWHDPDYSTYRRPARRRHRVAGDATPAYLFYPGAMERMHRYNPAMRLIASFRDPIERGFSHWSMERLRDDGYPDLPEAIERWGGDDLPAGPPAGSPTPMLRGSPFARGLYGAQLERAMALFPPPQWLLVEFGSLLREPHAVLDRATDLLGVSRFTTYPGLPRKMAGPATSPGARPSVGQVEGLVRRYAADLALFARLSGLDISGWPTQQAAEGRLDVGVLRDRLCDRLGLRPG
jgi:hypothetical protein